MPNKLPFLPDEHHYAIAHVASRAAQLDHVIEFSVDAQLWPHRKAAEYIIKNSDTNRLVGILEALLLDNFSSRTVEIDALIQEIKSARAERNEILHWLWGKGENEETPKLGSLRIHRTHNIKTKTAEEVYALAERLLQAVLALDKLNAELLDRASLYKLGPQAPQPHSASPETQHPPEGGGLLAHLLPPSQK